jgi:hypothetical protein
MDREYTEFGLDPNLRARGRALDERLARLIELWPTSGTPRIPIWCGGRWPHKPGLRRAARFDGAMPTFEHQRASNVSIEEFTAAVSFVRQHAADPIDIALEGTTTAPSAAGQVAPFAAAGMTWWIEALGWWTGGTRAATARIKDGPPAAASAA